MTNIKGNMKIRPKKSLGQHFLNSKHVLERIIDTAKVEKGGVVLEIGPGMGVLTQELLKAGAKVVAIEKDSSVIPFLEKKFSKEIENGQLKLIVDDILEINLNNIGTNLQSKIINSSYAIVANIPYYITGAILEKFLEYEPRPEKIVLLVQKEVAERIIARNGKESILSISVKAFGTPRMIAKVPRGAFTPPPNVDSAILEISDISDDRFSSKSVEIKHFFDILKAGFAHKRKFLIRNLETISNKEKLDSVFTTLNINRKVRAEEIKQDQWLDITKLIFE
ncbi:MAG: 16S rRNA (adenine(1518)-N(6)/adenine(1519)-N(6))-dimethyltransferase RsmA [Candidatus Paceibacterota bacterium]|jgi:16S rRNA (adenine1518-N6/adenine1519-N6)-dimethyltransferase